MGSNSTVVAIRESCKVLNLIFTCKLISQRVSVETMIFSIANWIVAMCTLVIALSSQVNSQIPTICADEESLQNLECCPNNCGADDNRGECADISVPHDMDSTDVRGNWPHYFTRACKCMGNYAGVDCTRCKYGYYGTNCNDKQVLPRKSIHDLTPQQWADYIDILKKARTYNSGYKVILGEYRPGTTDINMTDIDLYDLFVWQHHFAAKDSECEDGDGCTKVDYAHESTGFPTWHRQYLLWFEWEIQGMLKNMSDSNYYTFRLHYWDWRREDRASEIFQRKRLGETQRNGNNQPEVRGDLFDGGWNTICWYGGSGNVVLPKGTICNPAVNTGPLLRCPFLDPAPCLNNNSHWPTTADVDNALSKPEYDTPNYNKTTSENSFRNFMEGFDGHVEVKDCGMNNLCICDVGGVNCSEGKDASSPIRRLLHNAVHIIVGIGDFSSVLSGNMTGVMADVAASPNDPLFINHHGMIDCILEEWLQRNPDAVYPDVPSEIVGHQRDGFIVPFFPLFKHSDVFKTGDDFGYSCKLSDSAIVKPLSWAILIIIMMVIMSI